jgi:hypothetical protein
LSGEFQRRGSAQEASAHAITITVHGSRAHCGTTLDRATIRCVLEATGHAR